MSRLILRLSSCFTGGAFGGLINSLAVYLAGNYGITKALGVRMAPDLSAPWLYQRLIWGGLWGIVFLWVHPAQGRWVLRAFLVSLLPTAFQLLYVFPQIAGKGYFGFDLGMITPAIVVVFNLIWGLAAAVWIRRSGV